jgi:hypothetical protein
MVSFPRPERWFRVFFIFWRVISEREMTLDSGPGRGIHSIWILGWGCEKPIEVNVARSACLPEAVKRPSSLLDGLHMQPLLLSFDGCSAPCFISLWVVQLVNGLTQ